MTYRTVIADRMPEQRTLLRLALARDPDFDVVAEAADGRRAVELVDRCDADILLVDVALPELDGLEVIAAVRERTPACSCILVSSLERRELERAGGAVGAVGVVARSTPPTRLAADVRLLAAAVDAAADAMAATMTVEPDNLAPRSVRRFVGEVLGGHDDVLDTVQLLVTELVTNTVMHARSSAEVVVRILPDAVRVEVTDRDDSFPVRRRARIDQPGGRGLDLVEQLSRSWGIDMLDVGKRTWFEVARTAAEVAAP